MAMRMGVNSPFFEQIRDGQKTIEGRLATPKWLSLRRGDKLEIFKAHAPREKFFAVVSEVRHHNDITLGYVLKSFLISENLNHLLPGVDSFSHAIEIYEKFYTMEKIQKEGMLAIELVALPRPS